MIGAASNAETRYGNHAMETLINDIIALGGPRSQFEVKMFGGGHVIDSSMAHRAEETIEFAAALSGERRTCRSSPSMSGGFHPRRIHYFPQTGKVQMLQLRRGADEAVFKAEDGLQAPHRHQAGRRRRRPAGLRRQKMGAKVRVLVVDELALIARLLSR